VSAKINITTEILSGIAICSTQWELLCPLSQCTHCWP